MNFKEADIIRFLKDELSEEDRRSFLQAVKSDPALREDYFRMKDVWDYSGMKLGALHYDQKAEWEDLNHRMKSPVRQLRFRKWMRVASVAAAVMVAFVIGQMHLWTPSTQQKQLANHVFMAPEGQMSEVVLADGSKVTLNAGSKIIVPLDFGTQYRNLTLEGEGFFDVSKDRDKAFIVSSGNQKVKVLGTRFNIRAYPDETTFETTLEEGSVEWSCPNKQVLMKPGMQIVYNAETSEIIEQEVNVKAVKSWAQGRYEFSDASFSNIIGVVERWYGVKVIYDQSDFEGKHFNGVIKKPASLAQTMQIISLMNPIRYSINNDTIRIKTIK